MTAFYTATNTPAYGSLTADGRLQKGLPVGWFSGSPVVTIVSQGSRETAFKVSLGTWDFRECVCAIDCSVTADVEVASPSAPSGAPAYSHYTQLPLNSICINSSEFDFNSRIASPSQTSPAIYILKFTDVYGNVRTLQVPLLRWIVPAVPTLTLQSVADPGTQFSAGVRPNTKSVLVTVPVTATGAVSLTAYVTHYQVERYLGHPGSKVLLRDWKEVAEFTSPSNVIWDPHLQAGKVYGYRVRYRQDPTNVTEWSAWTTIAT